MLRLRLPLAIAALLAHLPAVALGQSALRPAQVAAADAPAPSERLPTSYAVPNSLEAKSALPPGSYLTLQSLEAFACANNPALMEAAGRVQQARGQWVQAGLPPNWEAGYSGQQLGSPTTQQNGVVVQKEFVTGQKLSLQQEAAAWNYQVAQQQYQMTCQRVLTDVRTRYFEALTAARRLQISDELLATAQRTRETADKLFAAQEVSRIDVLQAKIEYEQARLNVQRVRNRLDAAWRELGAVIGASDFTMQPLLGDLASFIPKIEWDAALDRILSNSPQLAAAQADMQRASWNLRRQRAEPIPNVTMQGIVQRDEDVQAWDGAVQLLVPLPILNRNQGAIAAASGELVAAQRRVERIELALTQKLAQAYQRYADAQAEVERYGIDILPNARENLELVNRAYQAGEFAYLNVLVAQRTLFNANLEYIDALGRLRQAAAEIEGYLLTESLQTNPNQQD
jgi:cobalt-zinc-cadmium efflux system outer membrane protein